MEISIHSPHMGRDPYRNVNVQYTGLNFNPLSPHGERPILRQDGRLNFDFNPLSPHGERQKVMAWWLQGQQFQSTLPAWGETQPFFIFKNYITISIHSPRMGRDVAGFELLQYRYPFQSTLPAWGETNPRSRMMGLR